MRFHPVAGGNGGAGLVCRETLADNVAPINPPGTHTHGRQARLGWVHRFPRGPVPLLDGTYIRKITLHN